MTVNYEINKSDGSIFLTVPQGTAVDQAGLTLIGKNYVAFGEALNENIVHLAENFAATSPPSGPLTGQLWYDKTNKALKVYSGAQFNSLITGVFQNSQPTSPAENQFWYDTSDKRLYVYNNGSFRLVGPTGVADTQVIGDTIIDTVGDPHKVIRVLVNNKNVAIVTDETFIPAAAQVGFKSVPLPTFAPGINIGDDTTWDFKVRGISTVAEALKDGSGTLTAANIIRNNTNGVIAGTLNADNGLSVGSSSQIQLYPQSTNFRISNTVAGGNIYIQTTDGTGLQSTFTVTTGQQIGINTTSPGATLHVAGAGTLQVDGAATFLSTVVGTTPLTSDNSTKFATTAYVKSQFNDTVLTGSPTATGTLLISENSTRLATTSYVKAQFDNTDLTGIPTVPYISNLAQSDNQAANTKFVQDVITGTLITKADVADLTALEVRVTTVENDYSVKANETGYTGSHYFTSTTMLVPTATLANQPVTKAQHDLKAPIANPTFTGNPQAPTPLVGDNSTSIATTAWVKLQGYTGSSSAISGITVQDNGVGVGTAAGVKTVNFTGPDITVTNVGGTAVDVAVATASPWVAGSIIMWYGTVGTIPSGWALCDGTAGTPDLRDKFIIGAGGSYAKGATGGALSSSTSSNGAHDHSGNTGGTALTSSQMPVHAHSVWVDGSADTDSLSYGFNYASNLAVAAKSTTGTGAYRSANNASNQLIQSTGGTGGSTDPHVHSINSDGAHVHTVTTTPPYHAVYFIMKL